MSRSLSQVHEQKHGDIHNSPSDSKYTALIHTHNDVQAFEHKLFNRIIFLIFIWLPAPCWPVLLPLEWGN